MTVAPASKFAPPKKRYDTFPDDKAINAIPLSQNAEFELPDKEIKRLRYHLYKVNHDGIRRFRTLREDNRLIVWRIK